MNDMRDESVLTEDRAAQLLDRAACLDAEGGTRVSVDELRQVALEAGISPESFERALAEMRTFPSESSVPAPTLRRSSDPAVVPGHHSLLAKVLRRSGIFAAGSALAFLSQTFVSDIGMDDGPVVVFTLVVAMFMALWFAVTRRRDRQVLDFEVDLGVLWTALTFWFMVTNPGDAADVLEVMMPLGVMSSLVGGLLVATGSPEGRPEQLPEHT